MIFFLKKTLTRLEVDGMFLNLIKAIYENHTANVIDDGTRLNAFTPRSGPRYGCLLSIFLFNIMEVRHGNLERRINTRHPDCKEVKLPLFAVHMILYIENPKEYMHTYIHTHTHIQNLLKLINEFGKVAR